MIQWERCRRYPTSPATLLAPRRGSVVSGCGVSPVPDHLPCGALVSFGPGHMRDGLVVAVVLGLVDQVTYVVASPTGQLSLLPPDGLSLRPSPPPPRNPHSRVF